MIVKRGKHEFVKSYRPKLFSEAYNTFNKEALMKTLNSENRPHAYAFLGLKGTGKTSIARIIAKYVNCENIKNNEPCLKCNSCKMIEEGCPDIMEYNIAQAREVKDAEAIAETFKYSPRFVKNKVVIFDEAHRMSDISGDVFLKEIESERENIYFIFCTTETKKVKGTILDRITGHFIFKGLSSDDKVQLFADILDNEKFETDNETLLKVLENTGDSPRQIAKAAQNIIIGNTDLVEDKEFENNTKKMFTQVIQGNSEFLNTYEEIKKVKANTPEKIRLAASGYFKGCLKRSVNKKNDLIYFTKLLSTVTEQYFANDMESRLLANLSKCCLMEKK